MMHNEFGKKFLHTLLLLPSIIPATYFSVYVLVEKIFNRKKYFYFVITFLFSSIFFVSIYAIFRIYLIDLMVYKIPVRVGNYFLVGYVHVYSIVLLFYVAKSLTNGIQERERINLLKQEKLKAELNYLKGQIHPHFLFNTLNNLYSLALDKHNKTAESILKLSSLLNHMLYESDKEFIEIDKEIGIIKDYINLEKLRHKDDLVISFDVKGKTEGIIISPLLFLPFIENAFKHGISQKRKNNWIVILLEIKGDELKFEVENSKPLINEETELKKGIGLKNVRRRLELIYKDKFDLFTTDKGDSFAISLDIRNDINLNKHPYENY